MMLLTSLGFLMIHLTIHCSCIKRCENNTENNLTFHGVSGEQALLEYCYKPKDENIHTITIVSWNKVGSNDTVLEYNNNRITSAPGFRFAVPGWNNGTYNVSMLLTNTKMTDMGDYSCVVQTDSGPKHFVTATICLIVTVNSNTENNNETNSNMTFNGTFTDTITADGSILRHHFMILVSVMLTLAIVSVVFFKMRCSQMIP